MLAIAFFSIIFMKLFQPLPAMLGQPIYIVSLAICATIPCLIPFVLIEKPTMNPKWLGNVVSKIKGKKPGAIVQNKMEVK